MTNTQTLTVAFGTPIVATLNEKSAEGFDCLSLTVPPKSKKAELVFAPRAEGDVPYIYQKLEISPDLYQPEGWDFAFADEQYIYIRRPLPRLCHTDSKVYFDSDNKELTFLSEKAAEGYLLAAVTDNQYLFVPCPAGEAVTYRIDYGRETQDAACYLLPEQTDLDGDGMYFICAGDNMTPVKYYFANILLSTEDMPPCGDVLVPPELWEETITDKSMRHHRMQFIGIAIVGLASALIDCLTGDDVDIWLWAVAMVFLAACALIFPPLIVRSECKEIKKRLNENNGRVPRVSKSALSSHRPTAAEVLTDPATYLSAPKQKKALWLSLLGFLVLALLFSLFAVFGISIGLGGLAEGFSLDRLFETFTWLLLGIVCAPLAVVTYMATFKSFKKIWSYRKRK